MSDDDYEYEGHGFGLGAKVMLDAANVVPFAPMWYLIRCEEPRKCHTHSNTASWTAANSPLRAGEYHLIMCQLFDNAGYHYETNGELVARKVWCLLPKDHGGDAKNTDNEAYTLVRRKILFCFYFVTLLFWEKIWKIFIILLLLFLLLLFSFLKKKQ